MNKKSSKVLAALLALIMCLGVLTACQPKTTTPVPAAEATAAPTDEVKASTVPLVGSGGWSFSEKFSPFFTESAYDTNVEGMTQISMLTTDRLGGIIYKAIEGETVPYNGTDYTYTPDLAMSPSNMTKQPMSPPTRSNSKRASSSPTAKL